MKSMRNKDKNKKNEKFFVKSTSRPDLSNLQKPIDTSVSDLHQVSGLLENGTDEVKSILSYECNIIYECRICYSLFRSIVNLVSHKREYCREKFDITLHRQLFNNMHFSRESIIHLYKMEQTNNDGVKNDRILRSQVPKETNKKDLSAIIDMLSKKREEHMEKQLESENAVSNSSKDDRHIYLEPIDTNCSAVYQTIKSSDTVVDTIDLMKEQITELQNMMDQNALNGQISENQLEKSDSPIQVNMSDEENELLIYRLPINDLSCSICNVKFATKKTLTFHIKTLHTPERLCYPCPYCTNIFTNTWSVHRHLRKVHKKTNEQVRQLRSQIQKKAFHRKTTAVKKKVRATKVSALKNVMENSDKTQESINCTESNAKLCGTHRRRLSKEIPLPYLQYCQTPIAACDEKTIRIKRCNELSVLTSANVPCETEDNFAANTIIKPSDDKNIPSKNSDITASPKIYNHKTFSVQDVSSLSKKDWDMNEHNYLFEHNSMDNSNDITSSQNIDNSKPLTPAENRDNFVPDENLKSSGIIRTDANKVSSTASKIKDKKEKASDQDSEKQLTDSKEKDKIEVEEDNSNLQSSISPNEKNRTSLMESKIATIANFRKLRCLRCRRKFTSITNLRRHMAMHIGWNRYRCKLCDFKCFVKCDCVAHCNKMHNTQNNRIAIAEMVLEISQDEYTSNEDTITDMTASKTKSDNTNIIDTNVASSSCQPETRAETNDSSDSNTHVILQNEAIATNEHEVAESHRSIECLNIDAMDSDDIVKMHDLSEDMMNCRKLDDHPKLKQIVMEVIFGSLKQTDANKPALEINADMIERTDMNDNVNNTTTIDESKEASRPILDKHQRPTRNRIRPLNEDFIYDLKRKESVLINDSKTLHVRKKTKMYN